MARRKKYQKTKKIQLTVIFLLLIYTFLYTFYGKEIDSFFKSSYSLENKESYNLKNIPEYNGNSYVVLNDNIPNFSNDEKYTNSFELYSNLDSLGRCGVAYANIGFDLMPTEERGNIGMIKPSGWQTVKYDFVDGKYLYNRCHLIGFQLTGENANEKNLITCTRSMNTVGMLQFENKVANYIKKTKNHVLYRVTPIYNDRELVARGAVMEAYSVEDNGEGISFNVYVYNNEDGVEIDYLTGKSIKKE